MPVFAQNFYSKRLLFCLHVRLEKNEVYFLFTCRSRTLSLDDLTDGVPPIVCRHSEFEPIGSFECSLEIRATPQEPRGILRAWHWEID